MKKNHIIVLIGLLFVLNGCMSSTPSESDAKNFYAKKLPDKAKIISFKKRDGQKSEMFGVEYYKMLFEVKVAYPDGLNLYCKKYRGTNRMAASARNPNEFWSCMNKTIIEKGETKTERGKIYFEKRESGWKASFRP